MASFHIAFQKTIPHEGGYLSAAQAAKQQDSGGETYMGISRNNNPDWPGWPIIDAYKAQHGVPAWNSFLPESLGLTPLVEARAKTKYWDVINGDSIADQDMANLLFELYWGSGNFGIKQAQKSLNKVIAKPVSVDGVLGKDTVSAINAAPQSQLYSQIYQDRKSWYQSKLAAGNPNADTWLSRLSDFPAEIAQKISVAKDKTVQVVKENPILTVIALLMILGASALTYYQFFYRNTITYENKQA